MPWSAHLVSSRLWTSDRLALMGNIENFATSKVMRMAIVCSSTAATEDVVCNISRRPNARS